MWNTILHNRAVFLLDHIPCGVIVTDLKGRIETWNTRDQEIFGYERDDVLGRPITFLFNKGCESSIRNLFNKALQTEPFCGTWHAVRKDGSRVWVEIKGRMVQSGERPSPFCIITVSDMDQMIDIENRLEQNRAIAQAILQTSTDAIITAGEDGIIQSVNSAAYKMFGYSEKELVGRNLRILMPFPYSVNHELYMKKVLITGENEIPGKGRETTGKRKDGSVFPIELAVSEIEHNGETIYAGIVKDLTARRTLEGRLIEISNEERRRIGRDLHDGLGQMLTGIRMLSENLARKLDANGAPGADEVQEIAMMVREADELARSISRDMVQVDIAKRGLLVAVEELCRKTTKMTGIKCELLTTDTLEIENHSKALHLYRIVQEAVNNAIKHGSPDHVRVMLSKTAHHTSVVIDDDGDGFSDEKSDREGAGLQIMKHRAGVMGGILEFQRTEEGLTRVRCIVPNNFEQF